MDYTDKLESYFLADPRFVFPSLEEEKKAFEELSSYLLEDVKKTLLELRKKIPEQDFILLGRLFRLLEKKEISKKQAYFFMWLINGRRV